MKRTISEDEDFRKDFSDLQIQPPQAVQQVQLPLHEAAKPPSRKRIKSVKWELPIPETIGNGTSNGSFLKKRHLNFDDMEEATEEMRGGEGLAFGTSLEDESSISHHKRFKLSSLQESLDSIMEEVEAETSAGMDDMDISPSDIEVGAINSLALVPFLGRRNSEAEAFKLSETSSAAVKHSRKARALAMKNLLNNVSRSVIPRQKDQPTTDYSLLQILPGQGQLVPYSAASAHTQPFLKSFHHSSLPEEEDWRDSSMNEEEDDADDESSEVEDDDMSLENLSINERINTCD